MSRIAALLAPLAIGLSFAPASVGAQEDTRVASLTAGADARLTLNTALRTAQTILFPKGEQIIDVTVSDPEAYRPGVTTGGDSLLLVPGSDIAIAQMTVETQAGLYRFDLVPAQGGEAPLVVRVANPAGPAQTALADIEVPPDTGQYRLSGDRAVRPSSISDDGDKTYLRFLEDQAMPAVFAIGPSGDEEMVEGYMRGGVYTIDRVYSQLVFRIDKEKAKARRREGARR